DLHITSVKDLLIWRLVTLMGSLLKGLYSKFKFARAERLCKIIVDADLVSGFLIPDPSLFGKHYDGCGHTLLAQQLAGLHAVYTGHHHIQYDHVCIGG